MTDQVWLVTVLKSPAERTKEVLVSFYDFIKHLSEVKDLHFVIRDRLDDFVIISFRILCEEKDKNILRSKMNFKLGNLLTSKDFIIDPAPDHCLYQYVAWSMEEAIKIRGQEKFNIFCNILRKMSEAVIEMAKQDYFSSEERTEVAHVMSWMLGCTEYFKLTTKHAEVGYYDRIEDKEQPYLQKNFK